MSFSPSSSSSSSHANSHASSPSSSSSSQEELLPTLPESGEELPILGTVDEIRDFYRKHGFVAFRALADERECHRKVAAFYRDVVFSQPVRPEHLPSCGPPPSCDNELAAWVRKATLQPGGADFGDGPTVPEKTRRRNRVARLNRFSLPLMHSDFGACANPETFQCASAYEIRQDPGIYAVASAILGTDRIYCTIDRHTHKLPSKDSNEIVDLYDQASFLHFDVDPCTLLDQSDDEIHASAFQGKVLFTPGYFVAVPGTHTRAFYEAFCGSQNRSGDSARAKVSVPRDDDPLNVWDKVRRFRLRPGTMVIWNERLLHGHMHPGLFDPMEIGLYLGFSRDIDRPVYRDATRDQLFAREHVFPSEYAARRGLAPFLGAGISEREDRARAYREGDAPLLYPSCDPVWFYPYRWLNFPAPLQKYMEMLDTDSSEWARRMVGTRRRLKDGARVPHLVCTRVSDYVAAPLTDLGRKLVGLVEWD